MYFILFAASASATVFGCCCCCCHMWPKGGCAPVLMDCLVKQHKKCHEIYAHHKEREYLKNKACQRGHQKWYTSRIATRAALWPLRLLRRISSVSVFHGYQINYALTGQMSAVLWFAERCLVLAVSSTAVDADFLMKASCGCHCWRQLHLHRLLIKVVGWAARVERH